MRTCIHDISTYALCLGAVYQWGLHMCNMHAWCLSVLEDLCGEKLNELSSCAEHACAYTWMVCKRLRRVKGSNA